MFFDKVRNTGTGFDGGENVVSEGGNDTKNGFWTVGNELIDEVFCRWSKTQTPVLSSS